MYWEENNESQIQTTAGEVVDVAFRFRCESIPVDHSHALGEAVLEVLPWFRNQARAAIHSIHLAESGNGWMRPEEPDESIFPSRRTRLILRVPQDKVEDTLSLVGKVLDIDGHKLEVGESTTRELTPFSAIYARYLVALDNDDEEAFLVDIAKQLDDISVQPRKMLCGISKTIRTPDGKLRTRSLMLADLAPDDSLLLQQTGLGQYRHMGCGIFIPHKDIKTLGDSETDGTG